MRTSGGPSAKEIDWTAFRAWNNAKFPDFAGRYFLGAPYLWAHGEGGSALVAGVTLGRVAPIQCANSSRQKATGDRGGQFGTEDGSAIADYIGACIDMGELLPASDFVYVYLEVADGTALSAEYWTAWCTALFNKTVVVDGPTVGGVALPKLLFPFLPCIQCAFPKDAGSGKYKPDAGVTTALDKVGMSSVGRRGRCYAFWARAFDNAAYHAPQPSLDWTTAFDPYAQKIGTKTEPVPVQIWRHMDQPDLANPVPAEARRLSLDATHADSGKDPAFDSMLLIKPWDKPRPTEFGVDKGADVTGEIRCLSRTNMTLNHLPDTQTPGPSVVPALVGKTSFAFRYYSTPQGQARNAKDLTKSEALAIGRAGAKAVSVWEASPHYQDIPGYLSNASHGKSDAKNAFLEASNIEQPANTPIYFAIDCNVNSTGIDTPQENGRVIPTPAQIKAYFEQVRGGYAEYLTDQGDDAVPYYTGVFGCSTLLDMLYVEGLATHFWQAQPPGWGDSAAARPNVDQWKHANAWQVCGNDTDAFIHSGVLPCRQTSEWTLRVGWQATGGTFKIQIGAQETAPIQLTALAADVALAVKQIRPAGTVVTGKDPDTPLADGSHQWILFIGGAVDDVKVLNDHLIFGHDPPNRTAEQTFVDFVILDVAWGDTGGWTLR